MTTVFYSKPFEDLFNDAQWFAYYASEAKGVRALERHTKFPRTSILNSVLALESAANCCLDALPLHGNLQSDLEKLSTLGKFEVYFIHRRNDQKLDRGCKEFQAARELIDLRNAYIHPKIIRQEYEDRGQFLMPKDAPKPTNLLQIPREYHQWTQEHAVASLKTMTAFLSHFFIDVCLHTDHEAQALLLTSDGNNLPFRQLNGDPKLALAVKEWKLDMRFFPDW